ncbi:hypothetical protein GBN32_00225 [Plesiomonas shigelloides]|uniref:phage tail-collar fiber domain-containing protein n=1 Tax=Plesiomonas shigelloides TaxID=703 RepID=UPI001261431E|nr:phage tail protein [Plesiomonas shigelloides]KAB7715699.1 hypothetical protein GBN32_00225 [Plesiomonas shigelloides]
MSVVLTEAFERWIVQCQIDGVPARPDSVLFARMGRMPERTDTIPPEENISCRVTKLTYGRLNSNTIVCSATVDESTQQFTYDWICLVHTATNTLCAVIKTPERDKAPEETLIRNFAITYTGIAQASEITTPPQSWQLDINAWLKSSAEQQRQTLLDFYGHHVFIEQAAYIEKDAATKQYFCHPGIVYLGGLRIKLERETIQYPQEDRTLYLRAWVDGHEPDGTIIVAHELFFSTEPQHDHITTNNQYCYVAPIAYLRTKPNVIEDLRNVPSHSITLQSNIYDRTAGRVALPGAFGYGSMLQQAMQFSANNGPLEFLTWVKSAKPGRYYVSQYGGPNSRPIIDTDDKVVFSGVVEIIFPVPAGQVIDDLPYAHMKLVWFYGVNGDIYFNRYSATGGDKLLGWEKLKLKVDDFTRVLRSGIGGTNWRNPDIGGLILAVYVGKSDGDQAITLNRLEGVQGSRLRLIDIKHSPSGDISVIASQDSSTMLAGTYQALSGYGGTPSESGCISLFMRIA